MFARLFLSVVVLTAVGLHAVETTSSPPASVPDLASGAVTLPFEIIGERLFVAAVLNDDTTCSCLIDTGSEVTLLNRARVTVKNLRYGAFEQLQGAFVGNFRAQPATLKKLALGKHVLENCELGVINQGKGTPLEQIDMILGMDLLSRARFTVDFKHSRLIFWPPGSTLPKAPDGIERVQLATHRGLKEEGTRPRIMAKLNGKTPAEFLLDFGADTPLYVATHDFKELGFDPAGEASGSMDVTTPAQMTLFFYRQDWPKLELGTLAFEHVEGRVMAAAQAPASIRNDLQTMYNILGTPFLKTLDAVHIDMPAKTVSIDRPAEKKK